MKTKVGDITLVLHRDLTGRAWEYQGDGRWVRLFSLHFKAGKNRPEPKEDTANFVKRILA